MKEFDLSKWKEIEKFCSHILNKGDTLSVKELSYYRQELAELDVSPTLKATSAKVEEASKYLHQLIKDKTPWYKSNSFFITLSGVVLAAVLAKVFNLYPQNKEELLLQPQYQQESPKTDNPSQSPITNKNKTHNKSKHSDADKAGAGV